MIDSLRTALDEYGAGAQATPDSRIFGTSSPLDSATLVSLLIDIEMQLEKEFGIAVSLTDERAVSQENNPFKDVENLTGYIMVMLREKGVDCG